MESLTPVIIPSHTYVSDHDPNAQKNRIPTEAELILLKSLATSHASLIENLKEQVKNAQATHDAILARYQQQFRELEGTQSQLHESKEALQLMQQQCSALQAESSRLYGITHPIRRYPPDVLRCIFESTCDMAKGSGKIRTGIIFSHVCQRWRTIAHDTPRLWSQIDYTMEKNRSKISPFWSHIIPKIKAVPATIVIRDLNGNVDNHLKLCRLSQIPSIKDLRLCLTENHFFNDFLASAGLLPNNGVQSMAIASDQHDRSAETESVVAWDIGKLMEKRPISPKLVLDAQCILRITPSSQLSTITALTLSNLQEVDVLLILSLLNQLQELRLHAVGVTPPPTTAIQTVSASLRLLLIDTRDEGEPWLPLMSCPSLTAFHHAGPSFSEICIVFVALHVSILTLDYVSEANLVPLLAPIAPQVQSLCIEPTNIPGLCGWRADGALGPPFPSLKEVKLSSVAFPMSKPDFEAFLQMYCLPVGNPGDQSLRPSPLKAFSILVVSDDDDDDDDDDETWRASEHYKQAKKMVSEDKVWPQCENVNLSWVN